MSAAHMEHLIVGRKVDALPKSAILCEKSGLPALSNGRLFRRRHMSRPKDLSEARALSQCLTRRALVVTFSVLFSVLKMQARTWSGTYVGESIFEDYWIRVRQIDFRRFARFKRVAGGSLRAVCNRLG